MKMTASRSMNGGGPPRWRAVLRACLFIVPIVAFLVLTFAPIYYIIVSSLTPLDELFTNPFNYVPSHLTLANFQAAADVVPLGREFLNSATLAVSSAVISVVVCFLASYAFARIRFPGSSILFLGLLLSGFLPGIATIIPLFQMFRNLSLLDSMRGLVMLEVGFLLPFSIWIMTSFIRQIPLELEDAAQIDGAGFPTMLWCLILPVLRPAIATLFLINLITAWDEFFLPLIFSQTDATATLTLGIIAASTNAETKTVAWGNQAAMGLLTILPVFIIAMVFQKQIVGGLMAGALKG